MKMLKSAFITCHYCRSCASEQELTEDITVVEIGKHHHSQGQHSSKIYEATLGLIELSTFPSTFNKWYFKQLLQMLIKLESHSRQSSLPNLTCVTQAKESDSLILASSTEAFGRDRQQLSMQVAAEIVLLSFQGS